MEKQEHTMTQSPETKVTPDPRTFLADFTFEEMDSDPYPRFKRMREECPIAYFEPYGQWFVSLWDDCFTLGKDTSMLASKITEQVFGPSILSADGSVHRDLHRAVDPPLRPRMVPNYTDAFIRPAVRRYLEALKPQGKADASLDLLEKVSVAIVGDVMGLTNVDDDRRQEWFHALAGSLADVFDDDDWKRRAQLTIEDSDEYFRNRIEELTAAPDDSLLSHMIHGDLAGRPPRTYDDLIGTLRVLITGGFQEPGHACAATLYGLLQNPEQMKAVKANPDELLAPALQEGLRWLPPLSQTEKITTKEITLHGMTFPAGTEFVLLIPSANYDESRFENPEQFNIFRTKKDNASFGFGLHHCSGHALARHLGAIVLQEVIEALPNLRLDPDREPVITGFMLRGVRELPVIWDV
ncbi:cytochrome P450 [Streptomyces sp. NPDC029554]|uniref:cytochrome P450 n=1 Tax=Streptomyces sp. NPDC029554 TaxID=3155126 RepID=UPI0033DD871B